MKKIILLCIFALSAVSICLAQSNRTESLTITTYYPSPVGVYRNLKLTPTDVVPAGSFLSPGVMYYDNSEDLIKYRNSTQWVNLTAGGGGGGGNETNWNETSAHHIYNTNSGFVGIGLNSPPYPLYVMYSNADKNDPVPFRLIKSVGGLDQYLSFYLYPKNAYPLGASYLDATSLVYASLNPPRVIELATGNQTGHIRFNVFGHDRFDEVMRLVHLNGGHTTADPADQRVGIGTKVPLATLHVDSNQEMRSALMLRGKTAGKTTGKFTITPYADTVYLAYGCYLENSQWKHDPYHFIEWPSGIERTNYEGAKLSIEPEDGVMWSCYDVNGIGAGNVISSWNVVLGKVLWDSNGIWRCLSCPPSSRKLKENFRTINLDDILGKIDQLEVSRWNYKSKNKSGAHIGPVAEDFYRLFKTGSREDQLHLIDSIGVALAGVKALSGKLNSEQERIEKFKGEIKALRAQLGK